MYTVTETIKFAEQADKIWSEDERLAFVSYLANNPLCGDVIPKTGGFRKVRWQACGKGKRGGARIIYYNMLDDGMIICFAIYTKNEQENISPSQLKR